MAGLGTSTPETADSPAPAGPLPRVSTDQRRFTIAAVVGLCVALIPYLWVLWDGAFDPLRKHPSGIFSNFFDLQARALAHGHWWVPKGTLGIEAFVIHGRDYMYFGPFPAFLRMPVLALTDRFDSRLSAPSMLLAWIITGVFASLLIWRVRVVMQGAAALGRAEATALAVLLVTIMSGSTLLILAALPAVYYEALAWGAAWTIGALFALLGIAERVSVGRVVLAGALILGAVLSRSSVGWGCVVGAVLIAIWFASGRAGHEKRRWSLPVLAAGLVPLAAGAAVTWMKFGGPFSHPLGSQVYSKINPHRQAFLAANGGKFYSIDFIPSTLWAYLRPDGLRFSSVFPFIMLPSRPAGVVGDVLMDQLYRTASVPAAMPLLFGLGCWGVVTVFRPHPVGQTRLARIPVIAAAACGAIVLTWGGIAPRFTTDFLPLLALASALGLIDVFRRLDGRSRGVRRGVVAAVAALGLFCIAANLGIATETTRLSFADAQTLDYVDTQQSIADATGQSLDVQHRATRLPREAPANELVVVGDCAVGLYLSTGENYYPQWLPLDPGPDVRHILDVTYQDVTGSRIPLMTVDPSATVFVEDKVLDGIPVMRLGIADGPHQKRSRWLYMTPGQPYRLEVLVDATLHRISVLMRSQVTPLLVEDRNVVVAGAPVVHTQAPAPGTQTPPLTVAELPAPPASFCQRFDKSD